MSFENLKKLAERMNKLQGKSVVVGVISNEIVDNEISLVGIANVHEFGSVTKGIPERSFLRSTFAEEKANAIKVLNQSAIKYLKSGGDASLPFNNTGTYLRAKVVDKIQLGEFEPLSQAAIKRKKSDKPLIDTGRLVQSITYEVRNGKT